MSPAPSLGVILKQLFCLTGTVCLKTATPPHLSFPHVLYTLSALLTCLADGSAPVDHRLLPCVSWARGSLKSIAVVLPIPDFISNIFSFWFRGRHQFRAQDHCNHLGTVSLYRRSKGTRLEPGLAGRELALEHGEMQPAA